jgi:hypothetical protein
MLLLMLLCDAFEDAGLCVEAAPDAEAALSLLEGSGGGTDKGKVRSRALRPGVLVTDLNLGPGGRRAVAGRGGASADARASGGLRHGQPGPCVVARAWTGRGAGAEALRPHRPGRGGQGAGPGGAAAAPSPANRWPGVWPGWDRPALKRRRRVAADPFGEPARRLGTMRGRPGFVDRSRGLRATGQRRQRALPAGRPAPLRSHASPQRRMAAPSRTVGAQRDGKAGGDPVRP